MRHLHDLWRKFRAETVLGPVAGGGDWHVWDAPDGLRAIAAIGLGCVQAGAQKLGVIEASYASAIIGGPEPRTPPLKRQEVFFYISSSVGIEVPGCYRKFVSCAGSSMVTI